MFIDFKKLTIIDLNKSNIKIIQKKTLSFTGVNIPDLIERCINYFYGFSCLRNT